MERKVQELLKYQMGVEAGHFFSGGITQSLRQTSLLATDNDGSSTNGSNGGSSNSSSSSSSSNGRSKKNKIKGDSTSHPAQEPCFLRIRIRMPPPARKRVFFIRHGQSEWNRATEETYSLSEVFALDHPLSSRGVAEAEALRLRVQRAATRGRHTTAVALVETNEFLSAPVVLASPLTRALQTAMVVLRDHPTVQKQGIRLAADARELKNTISFDTISQYCGEAIADRSRRKLTTMSKLDRERVRRARAAAVAAGGGAAEEDEAQKATAPHGIAPAYRWTNISVDAADAEDRWWDLVETDREKAEHVRSFMMTLRMLPHRTAIVVGHSLCFKAILARYGAAEVPPEQRRRRILGGRGREVTRWESSGWETAGVPEDFKTRKLSNCAVVAIDLDFGYARGDSGGELSSQFYGRSGGVGRGATASSNASGTASGGGGGGGAGSSSGGEGIGEDDDRSFKPIRNARLMFGSDFKQ